MNKTTHICLFGGPNSGKSTISAGLFHEMKKRNIQVEYCTEYAKDLVYGEEFMKLNNQLMVLANQSHPWFLMEKQDMDYTINDGPFLLSSIYIKEDSHLPRKEFDDLVLSMFKSYKTINYFLVPEFEHYQQTGRTQTKEESKEISDKIRIFLQENDIDFKIIKSGENTINEILEDLIKN